MTNLLPQEWADMHKVPVSTVRSWIKLGKVATVKEKRSFPIVRTARVICIPADQTPPQE